jgi:hypothetical protein
LPVNETKGIGLTLNGTSLSDLTIDKTSRLDLVFNPNAPFNWDFAWKDPSLNSNWISAITGMIHNGEILITGTSSWSVVDQGG